MPPVTPSQTIGPFFGFALPSTIGPMVVPAEQAGSFWIRGRVVDGAGDPVSDALIETWQADASGTYRSNGGFGRAATDASGRWAIWTDRPGRVPDASGLQASHIAVSLFARGLLRRLVTRIYFGDDAAANADDPVLSLVEPERRATLIAAPSARGYTFEIRLQGPGETVFFESW